MGKGERGGRRKGKKKENQSNTYLHVPHPSPLAAVAHGGGLAAAPLHLSTEKYLVDEKETKL